MKPLAIPTRWARNVNPRSPLPEYPRPQMVRDQWQNLNGLWQYAITKGDVAWPSQYNGTILVPYPIESALSGVKKPLLPSQMLWYKRIFVKPQNANGKKVLLHFGAVDWKATVYINGKEVGEHTGGYTAFSFDITNALKNGKNELVVKVYDPTDQGVGPHGKQSLNPANIFYTPSSGIWQTVWMETVSPVNIAKLSLYPNLQYNTVGVGIVSEGDTVGVNALITVSAQGKTISTSSNTPGAVFVLQVPGPRLWSPEDPFLYDVEVKLVKNNKVIDRVTSYFGMRKIEIKKDEKGFDRIFLNNKYYYNLGTLDQGFWPDGLYTAPTDEALAFDIKAVKAMGFNTIRKHIKVEPARWYYHADKIGILVWQDFVNPNQGLPEGSKQAFEEQVRETMAELNPFPCITTWVLFNEKWGQYDQKRLTEWVKQVDPTRLVNGHSGELLYVNNQLRSPSANAFISADMTDVHSYPFPRNIPEQPGKARVLGEFGGIGVPIEGHLWNDLQAGWGYDGVVTPPMMKKQYTQMVDSLKVLEQNGLSASIYTQPFDVESEQNGIMTYDRDVIKLPIGIIRNIHSKLWPITQNYIVATKGFSAVIADTVNKDYAARLKQYREGKKDSAFLRSLALFALKNKDTLNVTKFSSEYISRLKNPIQENNVSFIAMVTSKKSDPGFSILKESVSIEGRGNSPVNIITTVETIIFNEEVRNLLDENPDWDKIEAVILKHCPLEGELIRGLCIVRYLGAANKGQKNATKNLVEAAKRYDERYHSGAYNDWAWAIFEKSNTKGELEKAVEWSRKAMASETDQVRAGSMIDTYANLLYKLGYKVEALKWQQKAVSSSPGDDEIKDNYEKMKRGIPTWPDIN